MEPNRGEARVGKYVLVRRVAKGGMAELYLANQNGPQGFERQVAIKRILPNLIHDKSFIAMFLSEAKIAAQLAHPNIIRVYDLGKVGESYYIAMEFVDGLDLEWISGLLARENRRMPVEFVASTCARVCDALHYAHQQTDQEGRPLNIIHRDVTPGNVMVSYGGGVKLVDFGIAKATAQIERTGVGVVKGKFYYLSPEQTLNVPIDHRADIFALGVTLYELTTGKRPFDGSDVGAIVKSIRDEEPPAPANFVPGYPLALSNIVMKAIEKDRLRRYHHAREMQADLDGYLAFLPTPYARTEIAAFMGEVAAIRMKGQGGASAVVGPSPMLDATPRPAPPRVQTPATISPPAVAGRPPDPGMDEREPVTVLSVRRPADLMGMAKGGDPFGDDPAGVELVVAGRTSSGDHPATPGREGKVPTPEPATLLVPPSMPRNVELPTIPGDRSPVPIIKSQTPQPDAAPRKRSSAEIPKAVTPGRPPLSPPPEVGIITKPDLSKPPPPKERSDLLVTISNRPRNTAVIVAAGVGLVVVALIVVKVVHSRPSVSVPVATAPGGVGQPDPTPAGAQSPPLPIPARPVSEPSRPDAPQGQIDPGSASSAEPTTPSSSRAKGPPGKISVDASPWASISLSDGKTRKDLGLTPVEVEVASGNYTLTADNPETGKREQKKVKVKSGALIKVRFTMSSE
jgi:hypothetical protein